MLFSNYNALAVEPMGHIAGVAAAIIASASTLVAVSTGTSIGRLYDGTVIPLFAGFTGLALAAFLATEWAERGRNQFSIFRWLMRSRLRISGGAELPLRAIGRPPQRR